MWRGWVRVRMCGYGDAYRFKGKLDNGAAGIVCNTQHGHLDVYGQAERQRSLMSVDWAYRPPEKDGSRRARKAVASLRRSEEVCQLLSIMCHTPSC